eukprot:15148147-Alexandrium_andersonii.AAC.1
MHAFQLRTRAGAREYSPFQYTAFDPQCAGDQAASHPLWASLSLSGKEPLGSQYVVVRLACPYT